MEGFFVNFRGELKQNHPLAKYTSWRVGGNAGQFFRPADLADLTEFLQQLPPAEPLTWLGLGSNTLIRDGGIDGTVILTLGRLVDTAIQSDETIRVESGVTCAKFSKFCIREHFPDGAFFAGIPGTMGGALAMNAGAFGGETWRHVVAVETLSRSGELRVRKPEEFTVQYRQVDGLNDDYFVAGHFRFEKDASAEGEASIKALLAKRNESQPIGQLSCGSVFRNPPGDYSARLIESAGLKGHRIGGAEVSQKHANFIINDKNATATDIENLIEFVAQTVFEHHGVQLQKEVHILGKR